MNEPISRCGNFCGICPWGRYQRTRLGEGEWDSYRDAAKKYVGYAPTEKPCHGCLTPDDKLAKDVGVHNFVRGCLARTCATHNSVPNCAYCSRYPCDWIEAHVGEITRETVSERIGEPVPDDAYESFIEPFQGKSHLDKIQANLSESDIVNAKPVAVPVKKIVDYPDSLESVTLQPVYNVLSNLASTSFGLKHPDTVSGAEIIKARRDVLFRLLWIAFQNGSLVGGKKLELNGATYAANKKGRDPLTMLSRAELYFRMLEQLGIHAELVQLHEDWTTGLGYLRTHIPGSEEPAWNLVISFDERIGGSVSLAAMKYYANELSDRFPKRAYTYFSKADMRFLLP